MVSQTRHIMLAVTVEDFGSLDGKRHAELEDLIRCRLVGSYDIGGARLDVEEVEIDAVCKADDEGRVLAVPGAPPQSVQEYLTELVQEHLTEYACSRARRYVARDVARRNSERNKS